MNKKLAIGLAVGAASALLLGAASLYRNQESLIYMPNMPQYPHENPIGYRNPLEKNLKYLDVEINTLQGLKLHGWLILSDRPTSSPTIIYYQENAGSTRGNNEDIGQRLDYIRGIMSKLSVNFLLVGYRGYSYSQGKPTEAGLKRDGKSILDWISVCTDIDRSQIYILGRSLGGAVACYVASNSENRLMIKGIILENTFTSLADVVRKNFGLLSYLMVPLLRNHWNSKAEIKSIPCPILFITGMKDELIKPELMKQLTLQARNNRIPFTEYDIENGTHNEMYEIDKEGYVAALARFMKIRPAL